MNRVRGEMACTPRKLKEGLTLASQLTQHLPHTTNPLHAGKVSKRERERERERKGEEDQQEPCDRSHGTMVGHQRSGPVEGVADRRSGRPEEGKEGRLAALCSESQVGSRISPSSTAPMSRGRRPSSAPGRRPVGSDRSEVVGRAAAQGDMVTSREEEKQRKRKEKEKKREKKEEEAGGGQHKPVDGGWLAD